jgi:MSHA biogenesis protein MshL
MKRQTPLSAALCACALALSGCADRGPFRWPGTASDARAEVRAEMAAREARAASAAAAAAAPVAPVTAAAPAAAPRPVGVAEPRFDLIVSGANARDVFLSMVGDTRYSMLMHPEVTGTMSVTLRSVTVLEALESIRDVYGYDFRLEGRRITVFPPTMQTRIFTVNYPTATRRGRSEVRVSGSGAPANSSGSSSSAQAASTTPDNSQITTLSNSDFWTETADALRGLLGKGEGRVVITSPQAGTIAVRAMPDELRQVEMFLRASRVAIERQVMLEAKIIEVELRQGFESGIDWSLLRTRGAAGQTSGVPSNALVINPNNLPTLASTAASLLADSVALPGARGAALGLSLASNGFQAVLGFLETHGELQILSSPRVATLNNQKAVLKVGVDEYFVTNVSGGSTTAGTTANNGTTTLPTLTLTPFFSGIALDVTPQIDEANMITLHLRPSVTSVTEKTKQIDLGTIGNYRLPLASSRVNETDTVVRVPDGNIVAIGGLMQTESTRSRSGLPGSDSNVFSRNLLGNRADTVRKKELVVLIKPTIIRSAEDWQRSTEQALAAADTPPQRTVVVNAPAKPAVAAAAR